MKKIGIWIDKEKAHIVSLENNKENFKTVESEIENYRPFGGSGSKGTKNRWGPQDVVQDSKFLEREKHQLKNYFKKIAETISDADVIAIFGPSDTNLKLQKELSTKFKPLAKKVKAVEKADSMTNNQLKALVKKFFEK
jgi:hypothetical protein